MRHVGSSANGCGSSDCYWGTRSRVSRHGRGARGRVPAVPRWHRPAGGSMKMSIKRFEIERVSVTSSRPFEAVVAALKDAIGRLDLVEFAKASKQAGTFADLKALVDRNQGKTGLMLFMELDHGAVLRKETGLPMPKIVRLVIGNTPVIEGMGKHGP